MSSDSAKNAVQVPASTEAIGDQVTASTEASGDQLPEITEANYHPRLRVYPLGVNLIESFRRHGKLPVVRKEKEHSKLFNMEWRIIILGWLFAAISSWDLLFINSIWDYNSNREISDGQQEPFGKAKKKLESFLAYRGLTLDSLVSINPIPHWIKFLKNTENQYRF